MKKVEMLPMGHRSLIDLSALESGIILAALKKYKDCPDNSERDKKTIDRLYKQIRGDTQ